MQLCLVQELTPFPTVFCGHTSSTWGSDLLLSNLYTGFYVEYSLTPGNWDIRVIDADGWWGQQINKSVQRNQRRIVTWGFDSITTSDYHSEFALQRSVPLSNTKDTAHTTAEGLSLPQPVFRGITPIAE